MKVGNPINALSEAIIFYTIHTQKHTDRYEVDLFTQMWGSTTLGFGGIGGASMTEAYTVVITGRDYISWVFFNGHFAYRVPYTCETFREDLRDRRVLSVKQAKENYVEVETNV